MLGHLRFFFFVFDILTHYPSFLITYYKITCYIRHNHLPWVTSSARMAARSSKKALTVLTSQPEFKSPAVPNKKQVLQKIMTILKHYKAKDMNEAEVNIPSHIYQDLMIECYPQHKNYMSLALDLNRQASLRFQTRDPWKYIAGIAENSEMARRYLDNLLRVSSIDPTEFARDVQKILLRKSGKVNTLRIIGPPNTGKSLVVQGIGQCFNTAFLSNTGSQGEFYFNDAVGRNLIVIEEAFITPTSCDDFKSVLSGYPLGVNIKGSKKRDVLKNTPVLLTGNTPQFGKGFLSAVDESALERRCKTYYFSGATQEPPHHLTPEQIIGWIYHNVEETAQWE